MLKAAVMMKKYDLGIGEAHDDLFSGDQTDNLAPGLHIP